MLLVAVFSGTVAILPWRQSYAARALYSMNPVYPWICVLGATILQLVSLILFIRDPEKAEE